MSENCLSFQLVHTDSVETFPTVCKRVKSSKLYKSVCLKCESDLRKNRRSHQIKGDTDLRSEKMRYPGHLSKVIAEKLLAHMVPKS